MEASAIVVEHLVKDYPKVRAVDIPTVVHKEEIVGLLGPNGAGKTATIRILLTLVRPTADKASLFDVDVSKESEKAREMMGTFLRKSPPTLNSAVIRMSSCTPNCIGYRAEREKTGETPIGSVDTAPCEVMIARSSVRGEAWTL